MSVPTTTTVIDRQELASRVTRFILSARSSIVAIHGRPASGKTELVTQWVVPALRARGGREVWYGECRTGAPDTVSGESGQATLEEAVRRPGIIILDHLAPLFALSREERRSALERMFGAASERDPRATFVLVADNSDLTSIYALGSFEPRLVNATFDVGTIDIAEGLQELCAAQPGAAPAYHPDVLRLLVEDAVTMEENGCDVTFELLAVLDRWFRSAPAVAADTERYLAAGRLPGILRAFLEEELNRLPQEDEVIARELLVLLSEPGALPSPEGTPELLARLGTTLPQLRSVISQLTTLGLVRPDAAGGLELVPQQLRTILQKEAVERRQDAERALRILDEGMRSWSLLGMPLPRARFEEIHLERRSLNLDEERIRFMLQSALRHEDGDCALAPEYWLRRMPEPSEGVDILLASLFADTEPVRRHAAALLAGFPDAEIRERLRVVSLTDPDEEVRAQAIASLESMASDDLMEKLIEEVSTPRSAFRLQAVEVLRVFKDQRVTGALQRIVTDDGGAVPLRLRAVAVLGMQGTEQSIDALLEIALHDTDAEDRLAAADALASTRSEPQVRRIFDEIYTRGGSTLPRIASGAVTAVLLVAAVLTSAWLYRMASLTALLITFTLGIALSTALAFRLRRPDPDRTALQRTAIRTAFGISAVTVFFWFHGLACAITGRWRRALTFFAVELSAVLVIVGTSGLVLAGRLGGVALLYRGLAIAAFLGGYAFSVYRALLDTVLFRERHELEERKKQVYARLLTSDVAARLLLADFQSGPDAEVRRARHLLRQFGHGISPAILCMALESAHRPTRRLAARALRRHGASEVIERLVALWSSGSRELRSWIGRVLCRRPSEGAMAALARLAPTATPRQRLQFRLARWWYRFQVWPRSTLIVITLAVPFLIGSAYHGFKVLTNPAWGQIMTIGYQPDILSRLSGDRLQENMIEAASVMAEHYPVRSAATLLEVFRERQHADRPAVHAAVARALVGVANTLLTRPAANEQVAAINEELIAQSGAFYDQLAADTSAALALSAMADSRNATVADTAIRLLQQFLLEPSNGAASASPAARDYVIAGLGGIEPQRALTALQEVQQRSENILGDRLRPQIRLTAHRAFTSLLERAALSSTAASSDPLRADELRADGTRLLRRLDGMLPPGDRLLGELRQWLSERSDCDVDGNGLCNELDDAYLSIRQQPDASHGYQQVFDYYVGEARYQDARTALAALQQQHPESVWPRNLLATLHHDYLFTQPGAFRLSYFAALGMRRLPTYSLLHPADLELLESEFVEIALSAEEYEAVEALGSMLLLRSTRDMIRLNLQLFRYAASVLAGDPMGADQRLTELEGLLAGLPAGFFNDWAYLGTRYFIEQRSPVHLKAPLLELFREGAWHTPAQAAVIIRRNRDALLGGSTPATGDAP